CARQVKDAFDFW
nr:immunoglobulin heavy chain junction region [Macaca mulatta]MOV41765.1 immunoglobulin heavy chain junction region [Macaca mulatta]MOV41825.1 immunoglobulin heavy chain junction region [Macaca mulatta]MOV42492.1 immunoglobulin heavy chain junction region [Macaca mulatta]MOV42894.1 immunoglobulin heavy chain junction region [Macaca mulatta]